MFVGTSSGKFGPDHIIDLIRSWREICEISQMLPISKHHKLCFQNFFSKKNSFFIMFKFFFRKP